VHERQPGARERVRLDHESLAERIHERTGDEPARVASFRRVTFVVEQRLVEPTQVHELHEVGFGDRAGRGAERAADGHVFPGVAADRVWRVIARDRHVVVLSGRGADE
jgi:hypothetical protein